MTKQIVAIVKFLFIYAMNLCDYICGQTRHYFQKTGVTGFGLGYVPVAGKPAWQVLQLLMDRYIELVDEIPTRLNLEAIPPLDHSYILS
jgi:hypothetical protein